MDKDEKETRDPVEENTAADSPEQPPEESEEFSADAVIKVRTDSENMHAWLTIVPHQGKGKPASADDVWLKIKELKITNGIDEKALKEAASSAASGEKVTNQLIAEGTPAISGAPGKVDILYEKADYLVEEGSQERIDYRKYYSAVIVREEQPLLEVKLPVSGQDGFDILGKALKATRFEPPEIKQGQNVIQESEPEKLVIKSLINGSVRHDGNSIDVEPVMEIQGDTDLSVGDIDFPGDVIIRGSVLDGTTVKADGNVLVGENVYAAVVYASGDVTVTRGILTRDHGVVAAEGKINTCFAENAHLEAGGDITIKEALIQSRTFTRGGVFLPGSKAAVIGGELVAAKTVECNVIGSEMGAKTSIAVGYDYRKRREQDELAAQERDLEEKIAELKKTLEAYVGSSALSMEEKIELRDISERLKSCTRELEQIRQKSGESSEEGEPDKAEVVVKGHVYPGTLLDFAGQKKLVKTRETGVRIRFDPVNGEIVFIPLAGGGSPEGDTPGSGDPDPKAPSGKEQQEKEQPPADNDDIDIQGLKFEDE